MSPEVLSLITAVAAGLCTAIPTIISVVKSNNLREALQNEKLSDMSDKIDGLTAEVKKYNDFDKRLAIIENIVFKKGGV